jgi:hypothetical protein
MKRWLRSLLNLQTLAVLLVAIISCFVAIRFQIRIRHNMMLFGLIVSFPLVFSLQSAFKRRERALEYLSIFTAGLRSISEAFLQCKKLSSTNQEKIQCILSELNAGLFSYLRSGHGDPNVTLSEFGIVSTFMINYREEVGSKVMFRIGRLMNDVYNSAAFLIAVKMHRTVKGVRILSYIFVTAFPIVQATFLIEVFNGLVNDQIIYFVSIVTSLVLSTLLLLQKHLEDPFDQDGPDDIQFEVFSWKSAQTVNTQKYANDL